MEPTVQLCGNSSATRVLGIHAPSLATTTAVISIFRQTPLLLELQVASPSHEKTHTRIPEKLGALGVMHDASPSPAFIREFFTASAADSIAHGVRSHPGEFNGIETAIRAPSRAAFDRTRSSFHARAMSTAHTHSSAKKSRRSAVFIVPVRVILVFLWAAGPTLRPRPVLAFSVNSVCLSR
jgi:hypothetical protein